MGPNTPTRFARNAALFTICALVLASCGWQRLSESATNTSTNPEAEAVTELEVEPNEAQETIGAAAQTIVETSTTTSAAPERPDPTVDSAQTSPTTSTTTSAPPPRLRGDTIAPDGMASHWSGSVAVGDGSQTVSLWLAETQRLIRGEITYADTGETRLLAGKRLGTGFFVHEFDSAGRARNTFEVGLVSSGELLEITGTPPGPIALELVDVVTDPTAFEPTIQPGDYKYAFAPFNGERCCGPSGGLTISNVALDSLTVAIDATTSGPAFNIATIEPTTLPLSGNVARFEERNDWLDCAFELIVFDGLVFVESVDQRVDCGFGLNASVLGIYQYVPTGS